MTMSVQLGTPNPAFAFRPPGSAPASNLAWIRPSRPMAPATLPSIDGKVSLRWFAGTLLTGVSGGVLIGAAIYAALGHQTYFAEAPSPALSPRKEINLDFGVNPRKGDRLVKSVDIVAEKQSFQAPADGPVRRQGGHESPHLHPCPDNLDVGELRPFRRCSAIQSVEGSGRRAQCLGCGARTGSGRCRNFMVHP